MEAAAAISDSTIVAAGDQRGGRVLGLTRYTTFSAAASPISSWPAKSTSKASRAAAKRGSHSPWTSDLRESGHRYLRKHVSLVGDGNTSFISEVLINSRQLGVIAPQDI